MTNQEKKRWMMRYRDIDDEIAALLEERAMWMDRATKITAGIGGVSGGGSERGSMESAAVKIAEISEDIDRRIGEATGLRREIRECIGRVKDPRLRRLLRLHYINGLTFEEVADRMHYSWRWVVKLHGQALSELPVKEDMVVHIGPW